MAQTDNAFQHFWKELSEEDHKKLVAQSDFVAMESMYFEGIKFSIFQISLERELVANRVTDLLDELREVNERTNQLKGWPRRRMFTHEESDQLATYRKAKINAQSNLSIMENKLATLTELENKLNRVLMNGDKLRTTAALASHKWPPTYEIPNDTPTT